MIVRKMLSILLSLALLFPMNSWAENSSAKSPLMVLLNQHREMKAGLGSIELINKYGKNLSDLTFKMMKDPSNKAFLSTPDGIELRKGQELLNNYLAVKAHLEKCVKDKNAKRQLHERLLQASLQSFSTTDLAVPCVPEQNKMVSSFVEFNNNMMKSMKNMVRPYFQNQLTKQTLVNTAKSLLGFKVKFQADFMKDGVLSKKELDDLVQGVCVRSKMIHARKYEITDICPKMDPHFKSQLSRELINFSKTQKSTAKLTPEKATLALNASIERMNNSLSKISVKNDSGIIYDSANLTDPKTKKEFDLYASQYMAEVTKDAGALLLTSAIRDASGGVKTLDSSDVSKVKSKFQFNMHKPIKVGQVQTAIAEVEKKMMNQLRDTQDMAVESTHKEGLIISDEDHIKDLVKMNPFAGGQVLLKEPQYAGLMCDAINKINQDDVDKAETDKYFTVGAAVLGGALLFTGVGTMAGAMLGTYALTGAVTTAAFASGTTAATVMGYVAVAGTASELINASYQGKRAYDQYVEVNRHEEAFLTKNGDEKSLSEASHALVEFKEARFKAGLSLVSLGMSALNAGKFLNLFKFAEGKISPGELSAATKILRFISENKVTQRLAEVTKSLGEKGVEKIDRFLLELAKVGEVNRVKFLELLADSKIAPQKIKDIVANALEALKNCEKL